MTSGVYKRTPKTPEQCAAMSDRAIEQWSDQANRDEMSRIKKQYYIDNPKALEAMSERTTEQFSDQANRDAMSEALKNSEAAKVRDEKQRGGYDIVDHHVAYDFGRPKALTVKITRKFHSSIHHQKGASLELTDIA